MNNTKKYGYSVVLLLGALAVAGSAMTSLQYADAQQGSTNSTTPDVHQPDSSPEAAVIIISTDSSGRAIFSPNNVTIRVGEEVLVLNNATTPQSFTSGSGANDPDVGTAFDTGLIQPKQFIEYTSANLQDGQQYQFFSRGSGGSEVGTIVMAGVIPEFGAMAGVVMAISIVAVMVVMQTKGVRLFGK